VALADMLVAIDARMERRLSVGVTTSNLAPRVCTITATKGGSPGQPIAHAPSAPPGGPNCSRSTPERDRGPS
jgi:hypothetical protein